MQVRRAISQSLECGKFQGIVSRVASRAWASAAVHGLTRALVWPREVRVIAIGGATLGGSGKTPLALACAAYLESAHVRVCIVGHAYRSSPGTARVVAPTDDVSLVGDEALMCARALRASGGSGEVVVGPSRQASSDFASGRGASVIILDGVLQTTPERASLALLAVDGRHPWGAGACPPAGDLRASPGALIELCDQMVRIGSDPGMDAVVDTRGAWLDNRLLPWSDLRTRSVGLITALARPGRVLATLTSHGVSPARVVTLSDHASNERGRGFPPEALVDLWLTTAKCRTGLPAALGPDLRANSVGVPVATLDYVLSLSPRVRALLDPLARPGDVAHSAPHSAVGAGARSSAAAPTRNHQREGEEARLPPLSSTGP